MKKAYIATAMIMVIIFLPRCKKVYEYIEANPGAEMKNCPILKINYPLEPNTLTFSYNSWDDPVTGVYKSLRTGISNLLFKYDRKRRLTELLCLYGDPTGSIQGADIWYKYFYDGTGKIVMDSTYVWVHIEDGFPISYHNAALTFHTYDSKDRIIKDSAIWTFPAQPPYPAQVYTQINEYAYDANGNRTGRVYDQKVNFHRTNKIWMFLDRDYSLNNPSNALSYNSNGLPTKFSIPSKDWLTLSFLWNPFYEAEITYGCK